MNKDIIHTDESADTAKFKGEPLRNPITKTLKKDEAKKNPKPEKVFVGYKKKAKG